MKSFEILGIIYSDMSWSHYTKLEEIRIPLLNR